MAANTSILLANPDFFSIKDSLKYHLKNQPQFRDYNFEGSNMNAILDLLATNTYQGAFMKNMIASELFLSTAKLSNSIYSRAKELSYVPRSARSASATLSVEITPTDSPSTITVPKETVFTGTVGSRSLTYLTDKAYILTRDTAGKYVGNVTVYEGLYVTDVYTTSNTARYSINNKNVDLNSLEVTVTTDSGTTTFTRQDNVIGIRSGTVPVYYISIDYRGFFEIYFGDNVYGATPANGSVVTIRYRVTSADLGNSAGLFRNSAPISGYTNVKVVTNGLTSGGSGIENAEVTRKYAPLANQIRDRAFTDDDYAILLRQAFPEIRSINVFGGETLNPPQYGKVAISITTDDSLNGISNNLKAKYTTFIKSKNPTMVKPIFIDPELIQVKIHSVVYYDYTKTPLTETDIISKVSQSVSAFNTLQLNDFNTILRKSNLTSVIDNSDPAINSNQTRFELTTIVDHETLRTRSKTIKVYNEIAKCTTTTTPSVYSTNFRYDNKVCRLVDSASGGLFIQTNLNNAPTNIKQIGTVDYSGIISLSAFDIQELYTTNLKLFVKPLNDDIVADLNAIIQLDFSEQKIETIAQKR